MSEITKLYENCGIEIPIAKLKVFKDDSGKILTQPPFTAEKQLELIKWLKNNRDFHTCGSWCTSLDSTGETVEHRDSKFEEALAGLINQLFIAQDLSEKEKKQVKGILE